MRWLAFLQRHFWLPMIAALLAGTFIPGIGDSLTWTFKPSLLIILTLVFAKIDMAEVLTHIRNPKLMIWLLAAQLVIVPLLLYALVQPLAPHLALGIVLLAAAPPAASSPVFTDLLEGNTPLCVSIYILSYLIVPFTLTGVLAVTGMPTANLLGLFGSVTLLIFVPLTLAQLVKYLRPLWIERTQEHYGGINLLVITWLIFGVVAAMADHLRGNLVETLGIIAITYVLFAALHLIGYWLVPHRPPRDRLAVSISMAYMNTALAVVLAIDYLPPEAVVVAVASEVPWSTMLAPWRWVYRRLAGDEA